MEEVVFFVEDQSSAANVLPDFGVEDFEFGDDLFADADAGKVEVVIAGVVDGGEVVFLTVGFDFLAGEREEGADDIVSVLWDTG